MPTFKGFLDSDLDSFFNLDEFAETHIIDGREITAIIEEDVSKIRSLNKADQYDGVYLDEIILYVKSSDLDERPVYGQRMKIDRKLFYVTKCTESAGMLEITLGANES